MTKDTLFFVSSAVALMGSVLALTMCTPAQLQRAHVAKVAACELVADLPSTPEVDAAKAICQSKDQPAAVVLTAVAKCLPDAPPSR